MALIIFVKPGNVNTVTLPIRRRWAEAVRGFLERSEKPLQASLAREIGVVPPVLNRHLRGVRPPPESRVRAVNAAAARLLEVPEVEEYLAALAIAEGLIEPSLDDARRVARSVGLLLRDVRHEFVTDLSTIVDEICRAPNSHAAFLALAAARGKQLSARLEGASRTKVGIDEVLWLLRRCGIEIDLWIRRDAQAELGRAVQRATLLAEGVLAKSGVAHPERSAISSELQHIFEGLQAETQLILERQATVRTIMEPAKAEPPRRGAASPTKFRRKS